MIFASAFTTGERCHRLGACSTSLARRLADPFSDGNIPPAMGIYDRDYYRESLPRGGFAHFSAWSVTTWLIVLNVAVFFADAALLRAAHPPQVDEDGNEMVQYIGPRQQPAITDGMGPLQKWGYFSTSTAILHGQVWRFITFQFLHSSPMHLVLNMVAIYLFGPIVEGQFGRQRFTAFYLLCGLAGACCYLLLSVTRVLPMPIDTPMVGASAGIFGLLVAASLIAPDVQIFYYFFPVTIRLMAIFGMLMALYSVISLGQNAGGEAAHLGGGILGFAIMKNQHWLHFFERPRRRVLVGNSASSRTSRKRRRPIMQKDWSKDFNR
jgi:membrane associated rhomboid family serine protease